MKRALLSISLLVCLVGCDTNKERNYGIIVDGHYVNTTESIHINTYNGYRLVNSDINEMEDGSVVITLTINKVIKQ